MSDSNNNRFYGVWRLVSCSGKSGEQRCSPFGPNPYGMLCYTQQHMMVFIAARERTVFSTDDLRAIPPEQVMADFSQFETYCGRYQVDEEKNIITHVIQGSKVPNHIGTEFRRFFSVNHDTLVLQSIDDLLLNNQPWVFELVWHRQE